ncbi:MAG TPA: VWA domain-containing protein, partial [Vicinamibacteria bacterium]|nr:VWA domain-containing protein [Vicinamibacteria bacterium]
RTEAGRKTVLLFSEGFAVAPGYEHVFADLQSRANRANVSFYGIDVRGLQLSTNLASSGAALATTAALSAQQRQAGSDGGSIVSREQMTQDDTLQTSLRSDVVETMAQLSTSTAGFLVTQTNDFGRALARVAEDMSGYYEASYVPSAAAAPGQFRRIEVRVARKDVHVQSRSGYYTTPPTAAGAFAAFAGAQLPADFEVRSRFYRFGREGGGPFDCLIKIEASLAKAEFRPDPQKGRLTGRMTLAGRVLNGTGDVVDTFGQDVALGGTPEQIEASRAQTLPLARRLKLPPGNYTVELLVRDAMGTGASGRRLPLTVPGPEGGLAMSSLVVVDAVEAADPKSDPTDPLRLADRRIVPNLGRPVVAAPGATLPIYYLVYVKPGATEAVTATVEVRREGRVVARGSSPLPPPDAAGRISGLSPIPLQKLQPGDYDVKVTVSKESLTAEETTTITVGS